jgi:phosphoribosylaminoimidazolecarboxamide formyltransferase / IMP cyclohydrolase
MPSEPAAPASTRVRRALLSVSDKTGVVDFARGLAELGVELVSTGGTARALAEAGLEARAIDDLTGFPEMLDGRVKTLNSKLYAGLLAVRSEPEHLAAAEAHGIEWVDLVCVNLYPFEATVASGAPDAEVIENIDIGGPTMLRAAAKNHAYAAVVTSAEQYGPVLEELRSSDGRLAMATRVALARAAYETTARYDAAISTWFARADEAPPPRLARAYERVAELSYGENPHQRAAFYAEAGAARHVLAGVRQLHGKQISYNNILDLAAARDLVAEFERPACAIIKHNNACGAAVGDDAAGAYGRAFACDPLSAFGGVIALNRRVDRAAAEAIAQQFVEVLIAPGFDDDALEVLQVKPNVRLLEDPEPWAPPAGAPELRFVAGGVLLQDRDEVVLDRSTMEVATRREPTEQEWDDLLFAWQVCRHVKSNAIVLAREGATLGIGAGQMSRVDSVRISVEKAQAPLEGAALASDAFFPFADGPQLAIDAGVRAVIQPGGSVRDEEVVAAADAAGVAMVLTRRRHFRH